MWRSRRRRDASPATRHWSTGVRLAQLEAFGKHLFYHWANGLVGHVHLGLFGRFRVHRGAPPEDATTVRMRLVVPKATIDLIGPTACSIGTPADRDQIIRRLGPDPLREGGACAEAYPHDEIARAEDQHDERHAAAAASDVHTSEDHQHRCCRPGHHADHHHSPHREREEDVRDGPRHVHRHPHLGHHAVVRHRGGHLTIEMDEIGPREGDDDGEAGHDEGAVAAGEHRDP